MKYEDRLRADFRKYLLKIACNKSDATLNELEILKAFDLAVQKQKLTTLEAEMLAPKHPDKTSIFDISRDVAIEELHKTLASYTEALDAIAAWSEGLEVSSNFDEPYAASVARSVLHYTKS
jgi:hypothetical protein